MAFAEKALRGYNDLVNYRPVSKLPFQGKLVGEQKQEQIDQADERNRVNLNSDKMKAGNVSWKGRCS